MVEPFHIILGVFFLENIIFAFVVISMFSFNIPVAILRFSGNKGRPTLLLTKAKKVFRHGVPRLRVRGYKDEFRDYLSENYYPTTRGKYGGLILWEFEDKLLTPVIPKKIERGLSKEDKAAVNRMLMKLNNLTGVKFQFDKFLFHELKLKAVDDVDTEFMLQDQARIDGQYAGGWRDFITKYAGHMTVVIIAILMLAGVAIWFDKMPEMAAQCYGAAKSAAEQGLIDRAVEATRPAG